MKTYRVEWCELIEAENPEQATRIAASMMRSDLAHGGIRPSGAAIHVEDHGGAPATIFVADHKDVAPTRRFAPATLTPEPDDSPMPF